MRIGVDIRAALHEPAGIGTLTLNLVKQLTTIDRDNAYYLYGDGSFDFGISSEHVHPITISTGHLPFGKLLWHVATARDAQNRKLDRFLSVGSLQIAALTHDFSVLVIPDLSHVLLPQFHVAKSRCTARILMTRALTNARTIVAISEHTKNDILTYMRGKVCERDVRVAHIACDELYSRRPSADEIGSVRERYSLHRKYVLSVGTIEPRKNHALLIKAFAAIAKDRDDIDLVIAGRKGWHYEAVFDEARNSGFESRIRFLDFVPLKEMPALYAMAEVFVYPSLYEGFGIPPLEAMSCGVPVITSDVSSLPEVIGDAGILVKPNQPDELITPLRSLLNNRQLRSALAEKGRLQARKFSWQAFAERILAALQV